MPLTSPESKAPTTLQRTCLACGEEVDLKTAVPIRQLRETSRISIDRLVKFTNAATLDYFVKFTGILDYKQTTKVRLYQITL